jgi:phosphoribosylamine-glycine ligase
MRQSLYNLARAKATLAVALRTNGTVNGTTVDLHENKDASRSAMAIVFSGTITDGSHAITLQESDDGSAWSAVAAADLQGSAPTITATDDDKVFELGYAGSKRYLRAVATTSGSTTGGTFGAVILRGFPRRTPIARS